MSLAAFVPVDRYFALADGSELPQLTRGAALFADMSGFTPLTETLALELGSRRGGEELTRILNLVYSTLIAQVQLYRGSVIGFSGDAVTCWFDGEEAEAAHRAVTAALAMQSAIQKIYQITSPGGKGVRLALKVAVSAGPVRRFVTGDPYIQLFDVLAGATVERLSQGERMAAQGEVMVAPEVAAILGDKLEGLRWRVVIRSGMPFASVNGLTEKAPENPWPSLPEGTVATSQLRPWLLPAVYERLEAGLDEFLTELRPATALFIRFDGLDYEQDEAGGAKLDSFVRWVQEVVNEYEGTLVQVTVGDKGSYLYAAFGAPVAHQNDTERAVRSATTIQTPPPELAWVKNIQIGISYGLMRCGSYGSENRHTYGVLGDEVNLAARLMQAAKPGQILVSGRVQWQLSNKFKWGSLPPLTLKGKSQVIPVFQLQPEIDQRNLPRLEPASGLPMVGREAELALIEEKLKLALSGQGQLLGIIGEPGMGKSRLVAEAVRLAQQQQMACFGGECQFYGINTRYLVWQPILRQFFGLTPEMTLDEQLKHLEEQLSAIDPMLAERLPLLGTVLNLPVPDNELTASMDGEYRKASLEGLVVDCLRARARNGPVCLVLEDCHWLDPLSHDLLERLGWAIQEAAVLIVLAYRPPELERLQEIRIEKLPGYTRIDLAEFTTEQAGQLIEQTVSRLWPEAGSERAAIPAKLKEQLTGRAGGNPFYIEELLNYLHSKGFEIKYLTSLDQVELPDSLHSLILSRVDQLEESQKITLKVASVIGRWFKADWLWGVYPAVGQPEQVKAQLERLAQLNITALVKPDPELEYLFKHIITREVAYASLASTTRTTLHALVGGYIERTYSQSLEQYLDLLAYHYGLSGLVEKQKEYFRRAGEAAQAAFSNMAAIEYYQRLLGLLAGPEKIEIQFKLGRVQELIGNWNGAEALYLDNLKLSQKTGQHLAEARALNAIGKVAEKRGVYASAQQLYKVGLDISRELNDRQAITNSLHNLGNIAYLQRDYRAAQALYEQSLALSRQTGNRRAMIHALGNLGNVVSKQRQYPAARELYEQSLALSREIGDKQGVAHALFSLGNITSKQGDFTSARALYQESLGLYRVMGDKQGIAHSLSNLGNVALKQGELAAARAFLEESLTLNREMGNRRGIAASLYNLGNVASRQGEVEAARAFYEESLNFRREMGQRQADNQSLSGLTGLA